MVERRCDSHPLSLSIQDAPCPSAFWRRHFISPACGPLPLPLQKPIAPSLHGFSMSLPLPPVLVVDDEKNMRLSLKKVLADEDYAVKLVESAEEALETLAREEVLMVITDARLGGMSGYEFLAKARAQWPELPLLMITAHATPRLAVEAIKAGAFDYVSKPFAPEELLLAVARCAERYRLLQENARLRASAGETDRKRH